MHKSVLFAWWTIVEKNKPQNTGNEKGESRVQAISWHNYCVVPGRRGDVAGENQLLDAENLINWFFASLLFWLGLYILICVLFLVVKLESQLQSLHTDAVCVASAISG